MALGESFDVIGRYLCDAALVDFTGGDMPGGNQVPQPLRCEWIELVIIDAHDFGAT
jgi:hypothetical protein